MDITLNLWLCLLSLSFFIGMWIGARWTFDMWRAAEKKLKEALHTNAKYRAKLEHLSHQTEERLK